MHIFLECWWAKSFWMRVGFSDCWKSYTFENIKEWLWFCFKSYPPDKFALICYGVYTIWRNRNLIYHNNKGLDIGHSAVHTIYRVSSFIKPCFKFSVLGFDGQACWEAPRELEIKINCDGSFRPDFNRAGMEAVARDSHGVVVGAIAKFVTNVSDSVDAEGLAILLAMTWAPRFKRKDCIFETDCAEVFDLIQTFSGRTISPRHWVAECADCLSRNDGWCLSLILREANFAADGLARRAAREGWTWNIPNAIPIWMKELL